MGHTVYYSIILLVLCEYEISSKLNINSYLKQNGIDDLKDECLYPLTEFSAIGFEMEMPILLWGFDFYIFMKV